MGQVLNVVTCQTCNYTNRKFDPFNMLSIPFPTVSDVVFNCLLLRRATPLNCPKTLGLNTKKRASSQNTVGHSPSEQLITEEHTITMSRLDDINDLKEKFSDLCGIALDSLRFFVVDETDDNESDVQSSDMIKLATFPEKGGPCLSLAKEGFPADFFSPSQVPTTVVAFESTLESRSVDVESTEECDKPKHDLASGNSTDIKIVQEDLKCCVSVNECRICDTDPALLAKALSQSQWPKSAKELAPGLRVDAIDHRGTWFPGTVIEVVSSSNGAKLTVPTEASDRQTKIKVHFDNFSSKWDLTYSFADFTKGNVQPLYSRSSSRYKVLDFQVFHSIIDEPERFFSFPFSVVCYPDWSFARAGAHILAQASRFLELIDVKDAEMNKISRECRSVVSKAIGYLVEADREYVHESFSADVNNLVFDGSSIMEGLEQKLSSVTSKLPFELTFCDTKNDSEEEIEGDKDFEFRLDKNMGNHMNGHGIVLQWKKFGRSSSTLFSDPFGKQTASKSKQFEINDSDDEKATYSNGGMRLGVCLDEFCKEQNLGEDGCWRCPKCKDFREGRQSMALWRLPDLLTFHLKRFNCSARYREKITTKVNFPLTGLNMKEWCDKDSPLTSDASCIYDLVGVVHHYGGMTGGHYVANCKVSSCSPQGNEEVEHNFNGAGVHAFGTKETVSQTATTWKLGRNKEKDSTSAQTRAALSKAKTAAESSEPLWLQFDDDSVEPVPPRLVNAESAYVLFYRRRQISPSSISRYTAMN